MQTEEATVLYINNKINKVKKMKEEEDKEEKEWLKVDTVTPKITTNPKINTKKKELSM